MPITVLIVDDSAIIRGLMNKALTSNPGIAIVGTAINGAQAIGLAKELKPKIIILDIEMPVMDGITALPALVKANPGGKIIISSTPSLRNASASIRALELGATDYLAKPSARSGEEVEQFYRELTGKVLALGGYHALPANQTPSTAPLQKELPKIPTPPVRLAPGQRLGSADIRALAIASSTGGPQALMSLFTQLKGHLKHVPIFLTQHMPPAFTTILAEQLAKISERPCREGKDGEVPMPGHLYIAPGDFHMVMAKNDKNETIITLNKNPQENFCRPAADPMLKSLSAIYGSHLAVAVLTGMGQDGLEGAKEVVRNGGSIIAQDEASCIVYGMPKAVADHHLCKAILPLAEIPDLLIEQIDRRR